MLYLVKTCNRGSVTEEGRKVSKQWKAKGKPAGCRFRKKGKNAATPNGGGHLRQFGHGYLLRQCTRQSLLYHRQTFGPRIMSS
jgi:hypothetical protein